MRMICVTTVLVSLVCGSLQAEPLVVMADKLLKTSAGRVLQRRLGQFIGQRFNYTYEYHGQVYGFSGKLERIVVPDITRLDGRIADAEFRAGFGEVVADGHQGIGQSNALITDVPFSNIINSTNHLIGKQVGSVIHVALPDEEPTVGRLVARYLDLNDNTLFHQVLIELAARDGWRVVEPRLELIEEQSLVVWQQ